MKILICSICFVLLSTHLYASGLNFIGYKINPDSTILSEESIIHYTIADSILNKLPFKNQNNLNRIFPGVVSYFQDFYIRGGESYETGFFIDGVKFNDLFSGGNSFFLNPNVFEKIDYYNGFIPNDFGNVSSGLFDYTLRTGGDKISFEAEHLSDNITFTNNPFSGKKRLGAYYYGHNETNISIGGPLYFPNVRFFANVNYLFQRDKNPQRYPGADNLKFDNSLDPGLLPDSIFIDLPAGIVSFNSFENINFLSTLLFDFDNIKIKASGIYFDENSFTERNHISDYLNSRIGLVNNDGRVFNIKFDHNINDELSYSLSGNYSYKDDITTDQYLGDRYWSYGDSVANANAGIIWHRSENDINNGRMGRYTLPSNKFILGNYFIVDGYPGIDHQKSFQKSITLSGSVNYKLENHNIRIGGDYTQNTIGLWQLLGQARLARDLYSASLVPPFINFTENELKEFVLISRGVNNIGYDLIGTKNDSAPIPVNYSFYIEDHFDAFNNFQFYIGLRYDYYDYDFQKMIDPIAPEKTIVFQSGELISSGLIDIESQSFVSPKAAIKFQAINNLAFTASYSQNVQSHPYSNIYEGIYSLGQKLRAGNQIFSNVQDLKPIVNQSIELGINYNPVINLNLKMVYFNKTSRNMLRQEIQKTVSGSPYQSYRYLSNNGSMDANGIDFLLEYYFRGIKIRSVLSIQKATELANYYSFIADGTDFIDYSINSPRINQINFNTLLVYDFSSLNNISDIFNELNFSLLFNYNDGHSFVNIIYEYNGMRDGERYIVQDYTPSILNFNLKIEKSFIISNDLNLDVYLYAVNLFDNQNIYNVFSNTGKPDDDGFSTLYYSQNYSEEKWAQITQLHQLLVDYNPGGGQQTFYGPPRQIGFGIKLNY
ncbi:MAG: TonB-dependent receptor [Ignavibacteriales bacterium]|nr:TonB-dependent receptor [Ignavibacteriales bacterium]